MTMIFPAIFIGGPPHSGKSTLFYRLSQALRQMKVEHYGLRASPDGEGDWAYETGESLVRELRMRSKEDWTAQFAAQMSRDIDQRHLPLLVDAGGRISPETAQIAAACTHGLLIASPAGDLASWRTLLARLGRPLLAELRSDLAGEQHVTIDAGVLHGTLNGLRQGALSDGPCFAALLSQIQQLFSYPPGQLFQIHCSLTSVELIIDLTQPIPPLPAHVGAQRWVPAELPTLLDSLPSELPMAIYGRGPLWLSSALAAFTHPDPQIFNPRHGWAFPPTIQFSDRPDLTRLDWTCTVQPDHTRVRLCIPQGYLDLTTSQNLPAPLVARDRGVILDGKLPGWLLAGLARAYRDVAWLAVYQPQLGDIVIASRRADVRVGDVRPA
ncbi:MAG: CRISPR-associated protein Csx3 [Chloroflexales bacterium]